MPTTERTRDEEKVDRAQRRPRPSGVGRKHGCLRPVRAREVAAFGMRSEVQPGDELAGARMHAVMIKITDARNLDPRHVSSIAKGRRSLRPADGSLAASLRARS